MVALFNDGDMFHEHFRALLANKRRPLSLNTTWPCVVEASHLLADAPRIALLKWIARQGAHVFPFDATDLEEMAQLMQRYTEQPRTRMDFADASLVWLAQQTHVTTILTIDVRDFSRYRLSDGRGFEIL
jgi:predicted nucleic acid-binding protein